MDSISLDSFTAYYQIKAFDVISCGQYKKHLSHCRETGEQWAVLLYNKHNTICQKIKEMSTIIIEMNNPLNSRLQAICKDVMTCAQPPIKLQAGIGRCVLSGEQCEHCLDLSRAGKETRELLVQNKYWYFFVFLWYCSKIEYIIRSCTKQWLTMNDLKPQSSNYDDICARILESNESEIVIMHNIFTKAYPYVMASLRQHQAKYEVQAFLSLPDEIMHDIYDHA